MTMKIPAIPKPLIGNEVKNLSILIILSPAYIKFIMSPPAITDAICPATFAPTACIKRKF